MKIRTTYICDGAIYCGFKPENADVKEERQVLYPEKGYKLVRKSGGENVGSFVCLHDDDVQENYTEQKEESID